MLNVSVIAVGKIKEKYFTDAIAEYSKRLGRYCRLTVTEVRDEPTPEKPSGRETELILQKEGARIAEKISDSAYVIALCIEGKMLDSVELSKEIDRLAASCRSSITFVIGGSMGLSDEIKNRADLKLSFSKMTFPHQLMRVILLEQLYRAFNISGGGKYHK